MMPQLMSAMWSSSVAFTNYQDGHAWTLAYLIDATRHWQFAVEGLRIVSLLEQRERLELPENATERTLQLALRYTL